MKKRQELRFHCTVIRYFHTISNRPTSFKMLSNVGTSFTAGKSDSKSTCQIEDSCDLTPNQPEQLIYTGMDYLVSKLSKITEIEQLDTKPCILSSNLTLNNTYFYAIATKSRKWTYWKLNDM